MTSASTLHLVVPFRVPFYAPFFAALHTGAFAREGLTVNMEIGGSGEVMIAALLSGKADAGWGGPTRVMEALDADPSSPLRAFCAVVKRDPFMLVGRHPRPSFHLDDLKHGTLGSVSEVPAPWVCLQDDLRRAGIDPQSIRRVPGQTMAQNAQALAAGTVDVVQLFEPHVVKLEMAGTGSVWAAAADRGDTIYTTFITTRDSISRHQAAFQGLARAMGNTLAWIAAEGPDALLKSVAACYDDLEPEVLRRCLTRYYGLGIWSTSPHVSRESFDRLGQAMLGAGLVKAPPEYERCVDRTIVDEAGFVY